MSKDEGRQIGTVHRVYGVIKFLYNERRSVLIGLSIAAAVIVVILAYSNFDIWTWNTWDIVITVGTLAVGLAVFFGESIEGWESRLTKRLTVFFQVDGVTRMVCYQAHLPHEGDIRNWSQQIGFQMSGSRLDFSPYLDIQRLGIERSGSDVFTHFQTIIYLKNIPDGKENLKDELETRERQTPGIDYCKVLRAGLHGAEDVYYEPASEHLPRMTN